MIQLSYGFNNMIWYWNIMFSTDPIIPHTTQFDTQLKKTTIFNKRILKYYLFHLKSSIKKHFNFLTETSSPESTKASTEPSSSSPEATMTAIAETSATSSKGSRFRLYRSHDEEANCEENHQKNVEKLHLEHERK